MTINENNYVGVSATLVGYVAVDPRYPGYDKNGERGYKEVPVAINEGYKKDGEFVQTGTTWYAWSVHQDDLPANVVKGAKIRIDDAKQEVREYENKEGEKVKAISLRFGTLTVLESPASATDSDEEPF